MKSKKYDILYLDDEQDNLDVFEAAFWKDYNLNLANSATEAINVLQKKDIHLIITDQRMPEVTGVEFLEKIVDDHPDPQRIILTGFSDLNTIVDAVNKGKISHYITKPWNKKELKKTIENALETFKLKEENRDLLQKLQISNYKLKKTNFELEARNVELENLSEFKSKLMTMLTHDLRAPLSNLSSLLDLGVKTKDLGAKTIFKLLKAKTESTLSFMNSILTWANSQSDGFSLNVASFNVLSALSKEQAELNNSIEKKNINLNIEINSDLNVIADEQMFRTVFRNVLTNAIKYSHENGQIEICSSANDNVLKLSISDHGIGMPKSISSKLFGKIVNSRPGTNSETGTGFGLILSHDFIQMHKGSIDIKSKLNKGTTVTSNWPLELNI